MEETAVGSGLARLYRAIVRVWRGLPDEQGEFSGTAFFISPTHALTAKHVVAEEDERHLYLYVHAKGGFPARIVDIKRHPDPGVDVALLTVDEQAAADSADLIGVADPPPIAVGAQLDILGFADSRSTAELRRVSVTAIEGVATAAVLQPVHPLGLSGGPALSPDGLLRGIVYARNTDRTRGYVVPLSRFRDFLQDNAVRSPEATPAQRSEHPADQEDRARLQRARLLLLKWRNYAAPLRERWSQAAARAQEWRRHPPTRPSAEMRALIAFAAETAGRLGDLPVSDLGFARSYGLAVHPAVVEGVALYLVDSTSFVYGDIQDDDREAQAWLGADPVPESYAFEMMERVFDSAIALARFGPDALPLGFIQAEPLAQTDLSESPAPLLLIGAVGIPGLRLLAMEEKPRSLGTFVARANPVTVDAARVMQDGSLEMIGTDFQYGYRWSGSARPSAQYPHEPILAAAYPGYTVGESPVMISERGKVSEYYLDGSSAEILPELGERCAAAGLWRDDLDPQRLHLLRLTRSGVLSSERLGYPDARAELDMGEHFAPYSLPGHSVQLDRYDTKMQLTNVEGFPCALVTAMLPLGTAVAFLDPVTLLSLRPTLRLSHGLSPAVAANRWLVTTGFGVRPGESLMTIIDLVGDGPLVAHEIRNAHAFSVDAYEPHVTAGGDRDFTVHFTLALFNPTYDHWICRLHWPSRNLEEVEKYSGLQIFPVERR